MTVPQPMVLGESLYDVHNQYRIGVHACDYRVACDHRYTSYKYHKQKAVEKHDSCNYV